MFDFQIKETSFQTHNTPLKKTLTLREITFLGFIGFLAKFFFSIIITAFKEVIRLDWLMIPPTSHGDVVILHSDVF